MGTAQSEECFSDSESVIPEEREEADTDWEQIHHIEYEEKPFINKFSATKKFHNNDDDKLAFQNHSLSPSSPAQQDGGHFETVNSHGLKLSITPIKEHTTRKNFRDSFFRGIAFANASLRGDLRTESVAETFFGRVDEGKEAVRTVRNSSITFFKSQIQNNRPLTTKSLRFE